MAIRRTGRLLQGIRRLAQRQTLGTPNLQAQQMPQHGQQSAITKGPPPRNSRLGTLQNGSSLSTAEQIALKQRNGQRGASGNTNVLANEGGAGVNLSSAVQSGSTATAGNTSRATPAAGSPTQGGALTAAQIGAQQRQTQINVNLAAQAKLKKKKGSAPGSLSQASI